MGTIHLLKSNLVRASILVSLFSFSHMGFAYEKFDRFSYDTGKFLTFETSGEGCSDVFPKVRFYAMVSHGWKSGYFSLFFHPILGKESPETWWHSSFDGATTTGSVIILNFKEEKAVVLGPDNVEYEVSYDGWLDAGKINMDMEIAKRDPVTHKEICRARGNYSGYNIYPDYDSEESNPFSIPWTCKDSPSCKVGTGKYYLGNASIGSNYYSAESPRSSCCALAAGIWRDICRDKRDPKDTDVICK